MTTPIDKARQRLLRKAFRMPSAPTIRSRTSTITNAFVGSIVPVIRPTYGEIEQALNILGMSPEDVRCIYCGDNFTEWDHLRPLVVGQRPTGYITEIANLVPSCNKCNQSKRNAFWREWMLCDADRSPTARGIRDVAARVLRLEAYEKWRAPSKLDFEGFTDPKHWEQYWAMRVEVVAELARCHEFATEIRICAYKALGIEPRPVRKVRASAE